MARLWSSGFELNSNTDGVEFGDCNGAGATIDTGTVRSGTYAGKILNPATGVRTGWAHQFASSPPGDFYVRFYLYITTLPNVNTTIFKCASAIALSGNQIAETALKLHTDGTIHVYCDDTANDVGNFSVSTGQWYRVEVREESNAAGGSNTVIVKLDGTDQVNLTNRSTSTDSDCVAFGANLWAESCTTGEWYFDDIAVNDTSGSAQNSWPGAGSIVHLHPNATGDFAEGANGAGGGSGWDDIDEVTPDDATSYWVLQTDSSASSSNADRLDVNCESMPSSPTSVTLVQIGVRAMPATNAACSFVPRIKSQASGTVVEGTTTSITGTAWVTHDDTATTKQHKLTRYTDPQAGGAWTEALINAMQIGVRAPDGNPDVRISTLWALVEYVPGAGGGTAYDRTLTETIAAQNPYARTSNASRTYSESAGSQNPYTRQSDGNRAYAETAALSDVLTREQAFARPLSESFALLDAFSRIADGNRAYADTVALADAYARTSDGNRAYSDSAAGTDTYQRIADAGRAFAESIASLDSFARVADGNRTQSDTVGVPDDAQRTLAANRSASDAVGLSDAYARTSDANRQHSDSIGLTDVYARLADALRTPTESLAGTDAFSRTSDANRAYADNLAGVESFARLADAFRAFTDTLGLADEVDLSTVGAGVLTLAIAEVIGLTDVYSRQADANRAQSDTLGALDAFARITVALRAAEDVVGLADAYARVANHSRAPSDSIGVDDEFARIADAVRNFTETLGLIDNPDLTLVLGGIAAAYYYRRYILARRF